MRAEQRVEPVDFGLQAAAGGVLQRLVRRVVVLVGACGDGGVVQPVLGVLHRLIDVHGDDADRADTAGARDKHAGGG